MQTVIPCLDRCWYGIYYKSRVFHKVTKTQHQNSEFGPKPGEIFIKPVKKKTLPSKGKRVKLRNAPFFWCQSEFFHLVLMPSFPFSWAPPPVATYYFHCSYMYNYYNHLEPLALLNAEFQHFIPRFNKTSLLCGPHSKRRLGGGVKRGPKTG
jgi:hypothetical protein